MFQKKYGIRSASLIGIQPYYTEFCAIMQVGNVLLVYTPIKRMLFMK